MSVLEYCRNKLFWVASSGKGINDCLPDDWDVASFSYDLNCSDPNIIIAIELKEILSTMTCIEEAAIRQITHLISIVKLVYGNIGSKGNTTYM